MKITIKIDNDNKPGAETTLIASDGALTLPMALLLEALKDFVDEQEDMVAQRAVDLMPLDTLPEDIESIPVAELGKFIQRVTIQQCTHIGNGPNYSTHN